MVQFSRYIADRWGISEPVAKRICLAIENNDSPFFLTDYDPVVASELEIAQTCEIHDFLKGIAALAPKKKRIIATLTKSGEFTSEISDRIDLVTTSYELDDLVASHRVNPKSKSQEAIRKGLGALADAIVAQTDDFSLDEAVSQHVGKDAGLASPDDVLRGVKDILVERFSTDFTVRAMARDFAFEQGVIEVVPKSKKDPAFAAYTGKILNARDLVGKEFLSLVVSENEKKIRLKLSIQIFQITELLREHFITNPESQAFDIICEAIDECWYKVLEPIVEKEVKEHLRDVSETQVVRTIHKELAQSVDRRRMTGSVIAIGFFEESTVSVVACDTEGRLLGAAGVKITPTDASALKARIGQFFMRYRSSILLIPDAESAPTAEALVSKAMAGETAPYELVKVRVDTRIAGLADTEWMKARYGDLDASMQKTMAMALMHLRPTSLIPQVGAQYFTVHALQDLVSPHRLTEVVMHILADRELRNGVPATKIADSVLPLVANIPASLVEDIRKQPNISGKFDLVNIPGMTEDVCRNIAGYVIVPNAQNPIDRTMVHPDHFDWINEIRDQLGVAEEALVADPEMMRSFQCDDFVRKLYVEKKLIGQVRAGQKYLSVPVAAVNKRRLKLTDIAEDAVLAGRVTNITPFGVFVDINAVCDGLIHISQLADSYVESPEQVVSVGDRVSVRVVTVDTKKRRVSLSMKGMGALAPKVKASQSQLNTLANYFKAR